MNAKLEMISRRACLDLAAFIAEAEPKLLEAWCAAEQEAQDNETKPKFKMSMGITLDLDSNDMETALTFGVRHKLSRNGEIPDPNQPELEGVRVEPSGKYAKGEE